ncbi:hypothetical protein [Bradyrhizobium sp.]|uniref:hypothetical protein n=1 Tax=Bradyrhizobium sp. TaxID=376 RepID=UPI003C26DE99
MMPIVARSGNGHPSVKGDIQRLAEMTFRFGGQAYGQWWTILGRGWQHEINSLVRGTMASVPPTELLRGMAGGYVNCLGELASIGPSMIEQAAMELTRQPGASAEPSLFDEDAGPEPEGEIFDVDSKPFAMPARVQDASQGWALYFVPTEAANRALGAAGDVFSAFDAGGGRTPLMIVGVDYRSSDFGCYPEFVLALTVVANDDPAKQLFTYYLAIVVTQQFTREAARVVWGLEKSIHPRLVVRYARDEVLFGLSRQEGKALSVRFPRFGAGRSSDLPTFSVSRRGEGLQRRTYWALTTKSGKGEGMQIGGSVALQLGMPGNGACLCADGNSACLCDMLRAFDIADRLPAANGWTERQTAVFGPPRLLDLPG